MENTDLKKLKKKYGEKFARLCRSLFPTLLETEGLLFKLISEKFEPCESLYSDITSNIEIQDNFKSYVYSLVDVENNNVEITIKDPKVLMDEAGYVLYDECQTEEEVQMFKKYYADGLCTFDGGRLNYWRVWFAVKKNVNEIKRENFKSPKRQDEYGTSVISIQFNRRDGTLSIKNRYNHTVTNPDATFSNNLDNIVQGLSESFHKTYNIESSNIQKFEIPGYVFAGGRYYKYNFEEDNVYYCPGNIIIDNGQIIDDYKNDKSRYIIIDDFIIDKQEKTIKAYKKSTSIIGFDRFEEITEINNKENKTKTLTIKLKNGTAIITLDKNNNIIEYENDALIETGDNFMSNNKMCEKLSLPNATTIGDFFLSENRVMTNISLPNATTIGGWFLSNNLVLTSIYLPNATTIGRLFLSGNQAMTSISLPNATTIGDSFLYHNQDMTSISLPKATTIGYDFLHDNQAMTSISLPNATTIGGWFLSNNLVLTSIYLPKLQKIQNEFLKEHPNQENIKKSLQDKQYYKESLIIKNIFSIGKK